MNPTRRPGATEICDPGDRDEDCDPSTFGVRDQDIDGAADGECCNDAPDGTRTCGRDCDDTRAGTHPGANEECNGIDDDCDRMIDEGVAVDLFLDMDGDMFGDPDVTMRGCVGMVPMYLPNRDDCDDGEVMIYPGAVEDCTTAADDNCDGMANELCICPPGSTRGCQGALGVCADGVETCVNGGRAWSTCSITPAARETQCDDEDDDCDGAVDEGLRGTCYADVDGDGFALAMAMPRSECLVGGQCPLNTTAREPVMSSDTDCCDREVRAFPGQTMYFAAASACGDFDFDCSMGTEEQRWTALENTPCASEGSSGACRSAGDRFTANNVWAGSRPGCGRTGVLTLGCSWTSTPLGGFCLPSTRTLAQECR